MPIPPIQPGHGRIVVHNDGYSNHFSELSSSYPLKLLSAGTPPWNVSMVYALPFGGVLAGGDRIEMTVEVHNGARLAMFSQGSTKVLKARPGRPRRSAPPRTDPDPSGAASQKLDVHVSSGSAFFLLKDPVTCYREASYHQTQTIHLTHGSSAVLVDWMTSGRKSMGEEWAFAKYYSRSDVLVDGRRVVDDTTFFEGRHIRCTAQEAEEGLRDRKGTPRPMGQCMAPYSCYATVILYGALVQETCRRLSTEQYHTLNSRCKQGTSPSPRLTWSLNMIAEGQGCMVHVAAEETEDMRVWLRQVLSGLEDVIGVDVYRQAFK
ncbi:UreD-domain-containing protein [Trametes coccinea BRFM310]|uniref:UreD-domain-containing protein n=1 Tax=Trametes coccinea (strain BRFM310) TaxID=1353009 RepID=A0A1Y2ILD3_TRAC3|nr:UreD-domain-containing protein [Trametes coccinea BRFM310]